MTNEGVKRRPLHVEAVAASAVRVADAGLGIADGVMGREGLDVLARGVVEANRLAAELQVESFAPPPTYRDLMQRVVEVNRRADEHRRPTIVVPLPTEGAEAGPL